MSYFRFDNSYSSGGFNARDPGPCLAALDDLGRAGWSGGESDMGEIPSPVMEWLKVLEDSRVWTSALDRELLKSADSAGADELHLCFWGWDSRFYREKMLLEAAGRVAASTLFFAPSPSFDPELEDPDMEWLDHLETLWEVEKEACPESGYESENAALVDYWCRRGEAEGKPQPPRVLIGESREDQLALVERQILQWLPGCGVQDRIGVVALPSAANAAELVARLRQRDLPVHDEMGRRDSGEAGVHVLQKLALYYQSGCLVEEFLQLLAACNVRSLDEDLDAVLLRPELHKLFANCQSRALPVLAVSARDRQRCSLTRALDLAESLGVWPIAAPWEEQKRRWQEAASSVGGDVLALEPLWSRLDETLAGREVPGPVFLEYITALLGSARHRSDPKGNLPFAKVAVVPLAKAFTQDWKHLIFLDCNEGSWPSQRLENPFLDDGLRADLNRRRPAGRGRLLTSMEQTALERRRFMELVENCRGGIALAAQQQGSLDPSKKLYPNEWLLQALMLHGGGQKIQSLWDSLCRRQKRPEQSLSPQLSSAERGLLAEIRGRRTDAGTAFDEYSFCYPPEKGEDRTWAVTQLGRVFDFPASFALKHLFDAESSDEFNFQRSEKWITGILVHDWLKRCDLARGGTLVEWQECAAKLEPVLRDRFATPGAGQTLWWESIFRMARWSVMQCLRQISEQMGSGARMAEQEQGIDGTLQTAAGTLSLRGRMDIVVRSSPDWKDSDVLIIDFKTGKADLPTAEKLAQGVGLQFGAYMLLALERGAASVTVRCINPHFPSRRELGADEVAAAQAGLEAVAAVLAGRAFGWKGPLFDKYKRVEALPLATVPVDAAILEQKLARTRSGGEL